MCENYGVAATRLIRKIFYRLRVPEVASGMLRFTGIAAVVNKCGAMAALRRNRQTEFDYTLAVCAIFKNEARYLGEWLTFHRGVGFEHFYLYNNGSSDGYLEVLAPWIDSGFVTLIDWPTPGGQMLAYRDCLKRAREKTRWLAFIDTDEFLFSPQARDVRAFLPADADIAGLFVYWLMFGSSGHVERPAGPVVEAYTRRADFSAVKAGYDRSFVTGTIVQGKSIVNPRLIRRPGCHVSTAWTGKTVDENGMPPPQGNPDAVVSCQTLRLNHYWSKSIEDLRAKVQRGRAWRDRSRRKRDLASHLNHERMLNEVEDRTIIPIWNSIISEGPSRDER